MTAEELSLIAGAVLSLLFSYVPGLSAWWEKLETEVKRLGMLLLLTTTAVVIYALSCAGVAQDLGIFVVCDKAGAIELFMILVMALIANQGVYKLTKG